MEDLKPQALSIVKPTIALPHTVATTTKSHA